LPGRGPFVGTPLPKRKRCGEGLQIEGVVLLELVECFSSFRNLDARVQSFCNGTEHSIGSGTLRLIVWLPQKRVRDDWLLLFDGGRLPLRLRITHWLSKNTLQIVSFWTRIILFKDANTGDIVCYYGVNADGLRVINHHCFFHQLLSYLAQVMNLFDGDGRVLGINSLLQPQEFVDNGRTYLELSTAESLLLALVVPVDLAAHKHDLDRFRCL